MKHLFYFVLFVFACVLTSCDGYLDTQDMPESPILGGGKAFQFSDSIFDVSSAGAEIQTTVLNYEHFGISDVCCNGHYYKPGPENPTNQAISCPLIDAKIKDNTIEITVSENTEKTDQQILLTVFVGNAYGTITINQKGK